MSCFPFPVIWSDGCPAVLQPSMFLTWIFSRLCLCCPGSFICSAQSTFPLTVKSPGILNPFWQKQFKLGVGTINVSLLGQKQGYSDAYFPSTVNSPHPCSHSSPLQQLRGITVEVLFALCSPFMPPCHLGGQVRCSNGLHKAPQPRAWGGVEQKWKYLTA